MPTPRKTPKASPSPKPDANGEVDNFLPSDTPQYVVNFSKNIGDRTLLTQIEETLAQHQAIDFSDLCKEALQQLLAPDSPAVVPSVVAPVIPSAAASQPDLSQIAQLQQQVAALETKIANLPGIKRLESLESLVTALERKVEKLGSGVKEIDRSTPKPQSETLESDPLLNRLSNLLEDF
jgi:septal ring factor EnvC (AmiA/AmiB activator)